LLRRHLTVQKGIWNEAVAELLDHLDYGETHDFIRRGFPIEEFKNNLKVKHILFKWDEETDRWVNEEKKQEKGT